MCWGHYGPIDSIMMNESLTGEGFFCFLLWSVELLFRRQVWHGFAVVCDVIKITSGPQMKRKEKKKNRTEQKMVAVWVLAKRKKI